MTVSVALCTFNGDRFLPEQIASIHAQTVLPDEVVFSDDGSSDATLALIRSSGLEARGVDVAILVNEAPLGVTKNFEQAIRATTGDIVVLSDQDDVWNPDRIARLVAAFEDDHHLLFVHTDAELIDAASRSTGRTLLGSLGVTRRERRALRRRRAFDTYLRRNLATGATTAFRRSLIEAAEPFPDLWVHDEWLAIVASATGQATLLDYPTIRYRQHDNNQIGVAERSLGYKVRRALFPDRARNATLAARADALASRLQDLGVEPTVLERARRKAAFERARADLPRSRVARVPRIVDAAMRGQYRRFASQGLLDVIRDLARGRDLD